MLSPFSSSVMPLPNELVDSFFLSVSRDTDSIAAVDDTAIKWDDDGFEIAHLSSEQMRRKHDDDGMSSNRKKRRQRDGDAKVPRQKNVSHSSSLAFDTSSLAFDTSSLALDTSSSLALDTTVIVPSHIGDGCCTYQMCPNPSHSSSGLWKIVYPETNAGNQDWSALVGEKLCHACWTQFRTKGTLLRKQRKILRVIAPKQ